MDRLCALFTEMDFAGVSTYIASGNVLFDAALPDADGAAEVLETVSYTHLTLPTSDLV